MNLSLKKKQFILRWGKIGAQWGMNRTVAQIHALLFLSSEPLTADEIKTALDVARSNVSMSIKELLGWGLIRTVEVMGDRKTRYETIKDGKETFRLIMRERKKREIMPALTLMDEFLSEAKKGSEEAQARSQMRELRETYGKMSSFIDSVIDDG